MACMEEVSAPESTLTLTAVCSGRIRPFSTQPTMTLPSTSSLMTASAGGSTAAVSASNAVEMADSPNRAAKDRLLDRKSVVEGKSVDVGGRRIVKKKKQ